MLNLKGLTRELLSFSMSAKSKKTKLFEKRRIHGVDIINQVFHEHQLKLSSDFGTVMVHIFDIKDNYRPWSCAYASEHSGTAYMPTFLWELITVPPSFKNKVIFAKHCFWAFALFFTILSHPSHIIRVVLTILSSLLFFVRLSIVICIRTLTFSRFPPFLYLLGLSHWHPGYRIRC